MRLTVILPSMCIGAISGAIFHPIEVVMIITVVSCAAWICVFEPLIFKEQKAGK